MIHTDLIICKADVPTANEHIYSSEELTKAIITLGESKGVIINNVLDKDNSELDIICGESYNFRLIDNNLICDIKLYDSEDGKLLNSMFTENLIGFRLVGTGDLNENKISNYKLEGIINTLSPDIY